MNYTWPVQPFPTHFSCKLCCFPTQLECNFGVLGGEKMTVYNCGPIYYTVCLLCLKFSLHCAKLTVPYRIVLFYLFFVCLCSFFNLSLSYLAATASYYSFLSKCLPYFRENGTFRLNVFNFTT